MSAINKGRHLRYMSIALLLLVFLSIGKLVYSSQSSDKKGGLTVLVTYGDLDNTPATTVYIEASGMMRTDGSRKSFILKQALPGRYETSLPPGIFDIFVSEGSSQPTCRRIKIDPGLTSTWSLKLKDDEVYLQN